MKTIAATKFKEQCLSILDRLGNDGIIISKRGKPIARLIPIESSDAENIGKLKGKLQISGDITSTGLRWNAQS